MSSLQLDAEALYDELMVGVRNLLRPGASLVGIWKGGAWLAERLQRDLALSGPPGLISSTLHRDDFSSRGLAAGTDATRLPFDIEGRQIVLIDDVLYTGRTIRAVVNELTTSAARPTCGWQCWSTAAGASCPSARTLPPRASSWRRARS